MLYRKTNLALPVLLFMAALWSSCASYNKQASDYYLHLKQGNYQEAAKAIDKNKLLGKSRNRLLYLMERGRICHLLNQWDSSNNYLNEADNMMESAETFAKDIAVGTLLNPMMQSYRAEGFERYMVHYYKSLNYLQLNQPEEAVVEARRISLTTYAQEDKAGNNRYAADAFALMLQGLIYERNNDINNAFIAYRNAVDIYLDNNGTYYETTLPVQLKKDLLRLAAQNGFSDELARYERLLNMPYVAEARPIGGDLVIFWEAGNAPVKVQQDLYFSMFKDAGGEFFFRDGAGFYNVPYNNNGPGNNINLENLRSFRVALPKYEIQPLQFSGAVIQANNNTYKLEQSENINALAVITLKERLGKELATTLTRLAVKKLAEAAVRPAEKKENTKQTEEEKKKQEKKDNQREAIALGLQLFNFASEKADTRNWQSLPHTIYYARIPLQQGINDIRLTMQGAGERVINLLVNGGKGMQFKNIATLK